MLCSTEIFKISFIHFSTVREFEYSEKCGERVSFVTGTLDLPLVYIAVTGLTIVCPF